MIELHHNQEKFVVNYHHILWLDEYFPQYSTRKVTKLHMRDGYCLWADESIDEIMNLIARYETD